MSRICPASIPNDERSRFHCWSPVGTPADSSESHALGELHAKKADVLDRMRTLDRQQQRSESDMKELQQLKQTYRDLTQEEQSLLLDSAGKCCSGCGWLS